MLLYLVKHSQPEIAIATKELSKANNGANPAAFKELLHLIKYVLNMRNLGSKIEPTGNAIKLWKIISEYTALSEAVKEVMFFFKC